MLGAFSLGLLAQISFIAHQVAFLEPTLGLKGAGWAVSLTSVSALAGRLVVGMVIDRVDRRAASAAVLCVQVSSMVVLLSSTSVGALYLGCVLFGFGVGNLITLPGLIVQQEFPRRDFARAVSLNVAINQLVAATRPVPAGRAARPVRQLPHLADGLPGPAGRGGDAGPVAAARRRQGRLEPFSTVFAVFSNPPITLRRLRVPTPEALP